MIYIAKRGNCSGPNPEKENKPEYIIRALERFHCEIDVWMIDGQFLLGHDQPQYQIDPAFLQMPRLWCHAKNIAALEAMLDQQVHCFWHESDQVTLTSSLYLWTYPGKPLGKNAIAVLPELFPNWDISSAVGICSDLIEKYC